MRTSHSLAALVLVVCAVAVGALQEHTFVPVVEVDDKDMRIFFHALGQDFHLLLQKDDSLFHPDFKSFAMEKDGTLSVTEQHPKGCLFTGVVRGDSESHVTVSYCGDLVGAMQVGGGQSYSFSPSHLKGDRLSHPKGEGDRLSHPKGEGDRLSHLKGEGDRPNLHVLSVHERPPSLPKHLAVQEASLPSSRDIHPLRQGGGVPGGTVVSVVVANDKALCDRHPQYFVQTRSSVIFNQAKRLFSLLAPNITIQLSGMISFPYSNPYNDAHTTLIDGQLTANATALLNTFMSWQATSDPLNNAFPSRTNTMLFSGHVFQESYQGIAALGALCSPRNSGQVASAFKPDLNFVGGIVAHELGHNFGIKHDFSEAPGIGTCNRDPNFVMFTMEGASVSDISFEGWPGYPSVWSPCSQYWISEFWKTNPTCFQAAAPHFAVARCGNGIVEGSEECDCGVQCATDSCCNGTSCQFFDAAVCSSLDPCCDASCQYESKDTVCRAATSSCDLAESCTGEAGHCPVNTYTITGQQCTSAAGNTGTCYEGSCVPHPDVQCVTAFQRYYTTVGLPGSVTGVGGCASLMKDAPCGKLWCDSSNSGNCLNLPSEGVEFQTYTLNGTQSGCTAGSACFAQECVSFSKIDASTYTLAPTVWGECEGDKQTMLTECIQLAGGAVVSESLCAGQTLPPHTIRCLRPPGAGVGAIIGAVIGVVFVLAVAAFAVRWVMKWRAINTAAASNRASGRAPNIPEVGSKRGTVRVELDEINVQTNPAAGSAAAGSIVG